MIILAVDPGDTTGLVQYNTDTDECLVAEAYNITGIRELYLSEALQAPNVVVAEDFKIRPGFAKAFIGNRMQVLRVLGALEILFYNSLIIEQSPSIKQAWPLDRLEKLWPGVRAHSKHCQDAFRHLAYYLRKGGIDVKHLSGPRKTNCLGRV